LENFQWWNPDFIWMPDFMEMNNKSKHEKFAPYTSINGDDIRVLNGCTLRMPEGTGINFGPNGKIKYGEKTIPVCNKRFDANTASDLLGKENISIVPWSDFRFDINGKSILPFLNVVLNGIKTIVEELVRKV
jgi:hypothetical protein